MNCVVCSIETNHGRIAIGAICDSETCIRIATKRANLPPCDYCGEEIKIGGPTPGLYIGDRYAVFCDACRPEALSAVGIRGPKHRA